MNFFVHVLASRNGSLLSRLHSGLRASQSREVRIVRDMRIVSMADNRRLTFLMFLCAFVAFLHLSESPSELASLIGKVET